MILYTICRILFYLLNKGLFPDLDFHQFTIILLGGLRFDLSAILYINLLYIVLQLMPLKFRYVHNYQKSLDYLFYVTNAIGLALNCIDVIYYRFTLRRTTLLVFKEFSNEHNYLQLLTNFLTDYYYMFLIWILLLIAMVWLSGRIKTGEAKLSGWKYYLVNTLVFPLMISFVIIGIRGGLPPKQDFPLAPSDAGQYTVHPNDAAIVQNTPFCFLRTIKSPAFRRMNYFPEKQLESIYTPVHTPDSSREFRKLNVVVIIVESLCAEALGCYNHELENGAYKGFTPFLDSLSEYSVVFMNSFANGRKSIDAGPAVLASIPALQEPFTLSFYSNNAINSLASCLGQEGYKSAFAHGAPNGSLGLNAFAVMSGFSKYIGKNEYGNDADYDGIWGIWDHKFLPFFARECTKLGEPFLASVFTVTSHHPYRLPPEFDTQFPASPTPVFKCLQYTDHSLRLFFNEASRQPWFKNSIIVITADHSHVGYHKEYKSLLGDFNVPILFYTPGRQMEPRKEFRVAQQIDIMPSILSFLGYNKQYIAFGNDLMNNTTGNFAINYIGDTYQLIWKNWVLHFNSLKSIGLYNRKSDPLLEQNLAGTEDSIQKIMECKAKAFIQQYNNRMIDNRLTFQTQ